VIRAKRDDIVLRVRRLAGQGDCDLFQVIAARSLKQASPRLNIGTTAKQRTALTFSHSTPDTELDLVVQRIGKAFGPNRTPATDGLSAVLRCPLNEQSIWICPSARRVGGPIIYPLHCYPSQADSASQHTHTTAANH